MAVKDLYSNGDVYKIELNGIATEKEIRQSKPYFKDEKLNNALFLYNNLIVYRIRVDWQDGKGIVVVEDKKPFVKSERGRFANMLVIDNLDAKLGYKST